MRQVLKVSADTKQKLLEIDKKILKLSILSVPAPLLLGFGLLGKYGSPDEIPFEFLTNSTITNLMVAVGAVIALWTVYRVFKLAMEKMQVESEAH